MDHHIPRKPRIDAWKVIAKNVEFHEFYIGIFTAILDDEIMNDVGPYISKAGWPVDVSHPVKIAAWRV
jgi:hypothetical protein